MRLTTSLLLLLPQRSVNWVLFVSLLGLWVAWDNTRRSREQGVDLKVEDVSTGILREGPAHPSFSRLWQVDSKDVNSVD
jgi:hypothetical protein